jgi:hypothetical protein
MAIYIDGRFAVTGKGSILNIQNPVNITQEIERVVTERGCCGTGPTIHPIAPAEPIGVLPIIRVPKPLAGKEINLIEVQMLEPGTHLAPEDLSQVRVGIGELSLVIDIPESAVVVYADVSTGPLTEGTPIAFEVLTAHTDVPAKGYTLILNYDNV